ncbi:MAG: hypothetical protein V3V01_18600 [Acidimicrobiales bacterium]
MRSLYKLFVASIAKRSRVLTMAAVGALGILLGVVVGLGDEVDRGAQFISRFGLLLVVPIASLVFASAALGDPVEDRTLVYLWLKPVQRWKIIVAATLAAVSVTLPLVGVPLIIASSFTGGGRDLVFATALACAVGITAYTGLFVYLGLRVKRALLWGLGYILIWEGFIARAGTNASRLSVRGHTRSILERLTDAEFELADFSIGYSVAMPLLAMAVAVSLASVRLSRQDVD